MAANPRDIIHQVNTMPNPPQNLSALSNYLSTGKANPSEVMRARNIVAEYDYSDLEPEYNYRQGCQNRSIDNMVDRAAILCNQVREAFPLDAEALGCPRVTPTFETAAENVIYTVCQRIRETIPTVTPEQFYCPRIPS
jgi:hypothetical protein